jgi:hypothetical protein
VQAGREAPIDSEGVSTQDCRYGGPPREDDAARSSLGYQGVFRVWGFWVLGKMTLHGAHSAIKGCLRFWVLGFWVLGKMTLHGARTAIKVCFYSEDRARVHREFVRTDNIETESKLTTLSEDRARVHRDFVRTDESTAFDQT